MLYRTIKNVLHTQNPKTPKPQNPSNKNNFKQNKFKSIIIELQKNGNMFLL